MSNWPFRELGTLTEAARPITYGVVKPGDAPAEGGITLVRGGDILGGRIAPELRTVSVEVSAQYRRTLLQGGELLVSLVGNPGAVAIAPPELAGANLARQVGLVSLRNDVNARFIMYAMMAPGGRNAMAAMTKGSVQQVINLADLKRLMVPVPPVAEQHRIASILGAYDDLIEVNRRRVAVLERQARGLFEEWFVRLRFPGHENHKTIDTPNGPLPEGWQQSPIKHAYDGLYDGPHATPPPADAGPVFLGIGNVTEAGSLDLTSVRHIAEEDFAAWTKRVTPQEGDIVFTYEATLNRYSIIPKGFRGCLGRRLALIRAGSKTGMIRYLYLYFFSESWRHVIAKNTLSGATVDRIPLSKFPEFPVVLPPESLLVRFDKVIEPIFAQRQELERSNVLLASSRDLLLPRLISGELSVAEAEHALEVAA